MNWKRSVTNLTVLLCTAALGGNSFADERKEWTGTATVGGVQVTREDADDQFFASNLFRENGIEIDVDDINRVVRDFNTRDAVVWVNAQFAGLPVFDYEVGYSFTGNRKVETRPNSVEPKLLGKPLPPRNAFPIDHRPDIAPDAAQAAWLERARAEDAYGSSYEPRRKPETKLGFYDLNVGTRRPPVFRLVWRVRPRNGLPLAMISAKKGDILHFDTGAQGPGGAPSAQSGADNASTACRDAGEHGPIMANEKVCAAERVQAAEGRLAELLQELRDGIESDISGGDEFGNAAQLEGLQTSLEASHSAWLEYRDTTCRYAYFQLFPGSMAKLEEYACQEALTEHRISQLNNIATQAGEGIEY